MIQFGTPPAAVQAPAAQPAAPMFATPAAQSPAGGVLGVSVPIELRAGDGSSVTVELQFGPEYAASADSLIALVTGLMQGGYPVRIFRPKKQGFGGRGGFGGGGW